MKDFLNKATVILTIFLFLSASFVFAHSESHQPDTVTKQLYPSSSNFVDFSLLSGFLTLIFVISTVLAGRFMKKGRIKVKTHHVLAYITLVLTLTHGIYNLIVHYF